jgi:putative DNA methylase
MTKPATEMRAIECDSFPFEFLSQLGERESWRKEIHRPIYHVHKWWANRLGSVFRGVLLGACLPQQCDLRREFYRTHAFSGVTVFDPFMGSGTTIGEAHKLGFTALGRDINPVAVDAVRVAFGAMDRKRLLAAFEELSSNVSRQIRSLYRASDLRGRPCDVLYYFWVMQSNCPECKCIVELFPSWIVARHASPRRKREIQILCPECREIVPGTNDAFHTICPRCTHRFDARCGVARGAKAICPQCRNDFAIVSAVAATGSRPHFKLFGKLVLTSQGEKQYVAADEADQEAYRACSNLLIEEERRGAIHLPTLALEHGYNTRQAMNYGFLRWRDFFNDRQLLALGWLLAAISKVSDDASRNALQTLFSGVLEFNNLFASYKGEGTGAVRHMFSHHILKPERMPIEANVWGTPKSSGAFSTLFQTRLLRALDYREAPTEVNGRSETSLMCSPAFSGTVESVWPRAGSFEDRAIYLSQGDSAASELPSQCIDFVVTDPPFFDNVHYSELADFFYAWQGPSTGRISRTTRSPAEVQDADGERFASKLEAVFSECHRVLRDNGLLIFSYHHSRDEGWNCVAKAVIGAGFQVVNCQPVRAEMSVGTPKSQAKEPIQLDTIIVCRKNASEFARPSIEDALASAHQKLLRLNQAGFKLSLNDRKVVLFGQLLTTLESSDATRIAQRVEQELRRGERQLPTHIGAHKRDQQMRMF